MGVSRKIFAVGFAIVLLSLLALAADFEWNWRDQQVIGRSDPSVGNTSKLKEADRTTLIDAIVMRLQKPMSEQGYDDDRIREIASTSRVAFVELGDSKTAVFATSLGLEGGCDQLGNCPIWIFLKDADGYVSLLDTSAASYTLQSTSNNGVTDIVMMHHVSAKESGLVLYQYGDGKYADAGCYTALWPAAKSKNADEDDKDDAGVNEVSDPQIAPCKAGETK
jgi:hypothetical protein